MGHEPTPTGAGTRGNIRCRARTPVDRGAPDRRHWPGPRWRTPGPMGAVGGSLRQRGHDDLCHAFGHMPRVSPQRRRIVEVRLQHVPGFARKRRRAGEHLIGDHPEAVDVGASVQCVAPALLGRHEPRRSQNRAGAGEVRLGCGPGGRWRCMPASGDQVRWRGWRGWRRWRRDASRGRAGRQLSGGQGRDMDGGPGSAAGSGRGRTDQRLVVLPDLGDAEVEHLGAVAAEAVRFEPDVVRLEVAVDDALPVRFLDRAADLFEDLDRPLEGQAGLLGQHGGEAAAVQVLHDEIGDAAVGRGREAEVGHIDDVGMAQPARCPGLALEPLDGLRAVHKLRGDELHRHLAVRADVGGEIDRAHPAPPEQAFQAIFSVEGPTEVTIQKVHLGHRHGRPAAQSSEVSRSTDLCRCSLPEESSGAGGCRTWRAAGAPKNRL